MFYIIGLGNPGDEYDGTRHNTGRMAASMVGKQNEFPDFEFDKAMNSHISKGKIGSSPVTIVLPDTFMNKSGQALAAIKTLKPKGKTKELPELIVIHDDLDIPFGKLKISFNKSSGGHKGVESIMRAIKTEAFIRVRVGISPVTAGGKLKKPQGEEVVGKFILAKFRPGEQNEFKKNIRNAADAATSIISEGREKAMGKYNSL